MKIQLTKSDIEAALHSHIADMGLPVEGKYVTIEFSMKRVKGGLLADIDITDEAPSKEVPPVVVKPRKPRGPNKAKATTEGAAGTVGGAIAGHSGGTVTSQVAVTEALKASTEDNKGPELAAAKQEGASEAAASQGEAKEVEVVKTEAAPVATTTSSLFN